MNKEEKKLKEQLNSALDELEILRPKLDNLLREKESLDKSYNTLQMEFDSLKRAIKSFHSRGNLAFVLNEEIAKNSDMFPVLTEQDQKAINLVSDLLFNFAIKADKTFLVLCLTKENYDKQ